MTYPSLTLVIPCHNGAAWLDRALSSIFDQAYPAIEVIVVDDSSTDASPSIAGERSGVKVVTIGKAGAQRARNVGLKQAGGDYVTFLDADDYLLPGGLAAISAAIRAAGHPDLAIANYADDFGGRIVHHHHAQLDMPWVDLKRQWLTMDNPPGASLFFRRDFLTRIGGWDESVVRLQDYELGFRAILETRAIVAVPVPHFAYFHHASPNRVSRQTSEASLLSVARLFVALDKRGTDVWQEGDRAMIGDRLYDIGRRLLRSGADAAAAEVLAEARARQPNYRGRSPRDRLLIRLLGLKRREQIAGLLRRRASRHGEAPREGVAAT